jgi:sterol 14-demethylase
MKFAKLEMALIAAYFISMFDFELSDKDGNHVVPNGPLLLDQNLHTAAKPKKNIYLRYKLRED